MKNFNKFYIKKINFIMQFLTKNVCQYQFHVNL